MAFAIWSLSLRGARDDLGLTPNSLPQLSRSASFALGISALQLLFDFRLAFTPEDPQVLGRLSWPVSATETA